MNARRGATLLLAAFGLLAGCTPEKDCRDGIQQLRPRVEGAFGTGMHAEATEQINQAMRNLSTAEELAKAGDFPGCVEKIKEARVLLNRSQRTNQQ